MKIIDAHAHIFPTKVENAAVHSISNFYDGACMRHGGSVDELLTAGGKAGVQRYVIFSCATTPHQVKSINNFIMETCTQHPECISVGTLHKDFPNYEAELQRLYDFGIRGIKIHPDFQHFPLDAQDMMPIYDAMEQLGMFLLAHSGDIRFSASHPARVARVAKAFPRMNCIAAHFGGWMQWDAARECLVLPNVYIDTSSTIGFVGMEPAHRALEVFDTSHIFFGTDFPMWDHEQEIASLQHLGINDQLLEDILGGNFQRFYQEYAVDKTIEKKVI